ncbi:hypothetical protein GCM10009839_17480 [Catenulispora yoronensis]|uniref:Uncharacterized protein n=1 Tax=Catenulispora yoronensis TaxID=450799 RepID=A0ABP5FBB2_9ACTN
MMKPNELAGSEGSPVAGVAAISGISPGRSCRRGGRPGYCCLAARPAPATPTTANATIVPITAKMNLRIKILISLRIRVRLPWVPTSVSLSELEGRRYSTATEELPALLT